MIFAWPSQPSQALAVSSLTIVLALIIAKALALGKEEEVVIEAAACRRWCMHSVLTIVLRGVKQWQEPCRLVLAGDSVFPIAI